MHDLLFKSCIVSARQGCRCVQSCRLANHDKASKKTMQQCLESIRRTNCTSGVARNFNGGLVSLSLPCPFPFRCSSFSPPFLLFSFLLLSSPLSLPSLLLEVGPPKIQLGGLGSAVSFTSGV